jgi:hypothetical protein
MVGRHAVVITDVAILCGIAGALSLSVLPAQLFPSMGGWTLSLSSTDEFKLVRQIRKYLDMESIQLWAIGALISDAPPAMQKKIFLMFIAILRTFVQRKALGLGNNPIHHQIDKMAEHLLNEYEKRGGM